MSLVGHSTCFWIGCYVIICAKLFFGLVRLFLDRVTLRECKLQEVARLVYSRVLAPIPLVCNRMAHIGKGKGYLQGLRSLLQRLNVRQIILCFDGTGNKFQGRTSPSTRGRITRLTLHQALPLIVIFSRFTGC